MLSKLQIHLHIYILNKNTLQLYYWTTTLRDSFTKQGKLARERNSKRVPMGVEISAGDLLTTRKLRNTDATSHLHIDQCNIPSAAQISVVAHKKIKKPQYVEKNRRLKKGRFARSFDRPGIAWLLVGGSKSSFISWSKLKITWLGKRYVWTMCCSCFLNKWIRKLIKLNNGANTSNLTSANISKSCYVINLNNLLP